MSRIPADPNRTSALVVGVGGYEEERWDVKGPAEAAADARDYLETVRGIPSDRIRSLVSNPGAYDGAIAPTWDRVRRVLFDLSQEDGDLLVVFWSGHGAIDLDRRERLFFSDATEDDPRNLELRPVLAAFASSWCSHFRKQLWIIDACSVPMSYALEFYRAVGMRLESGDNILTSQALLYGSLLHQTARPGLFWNVLRERLVHNAQENQLGDPRTHWPELGSLFDDLADDFKRAGADQSPRIALRNWDGSKELACLPGRASLLTRVEREEALAVVSASGFDQTQVPSIYRAALAVTSQAAQARTTARSFAECLSHLSQFESPQPLLALALGVARVIEASCAEKLGEWVVAVARRLGVEASRLAELKRWVITPDAIDAALLVEIRDAGTDTDREAAVLLTAWLWTNGAYDAEPEYPRAEGDREDVLTRTELEIEIPRLVRRVREALPPAPAKVHFTVEVMVPANLLGLDFDSWMLQGRIDTPLGVHYPVLVRSLERIEDSAYGDRWPPRWQRLRRDEQMKATDRAYWLDPGGQTPEELFHQLDAADNEVCVGLAFAPGDDEPWVDCAVLAGIPVMLWLRRNGGDPELMRRRLCEELGETSIEALPSWIVAARRRGWAGDADHPLRHLVLLWDDAERGVPDRGPQLGTTS